MDSTMNESELTSADGSCSSAKLWMGCEPGMCIEHCKHCASRNSRREIGVTTDPFSLHGTGEAAVWCLYASLIDLAQHPDDPIVDKFVLTDLPATHMDPDCPELLNVLRITDIPQVVDLLSEFTEVELLNSEQE